MNSGDLESLIVFVSLISLLAVLFVFVRLDTAKRGYGGSKSVPPIDPRPEIRRITNEIEQWLIDDGCMSDLFTLTTWDESTPVPVPKPTTPAHGAISFVSPTYRQGDIMTIPQIPVSPTLEVSGPKTQYCTWCRKPTQRTKGGMCVPCYKSGVR